MLVFQGVCQANSNHIKNGTIAWNRKKMTRVISKKKKNFIQIGSIKHLQPPVESNWFSCEHVPPQLKRSNRQSPVAEEKNGVFFTHQPKNATQNSMEVHTRKLTNDNGNNGP